ncbi:MAG: metalloregulator ArsR/SmtB family transcription factor [Balneolales bacterium]|nr:metalloregulator ArsR/SmtB family transcription factor [Balneolales bacterium]
MRRDVFQGIADPTRREIIALLAEGKPLNLNAIADQFEISRPAISKHIKILEECNLIDIQQTGRERICELKPDELNPVSDWVKQTTNLWNSRLDALEDYLNKLQSNQ